MSRALFARLVSALGARFGGPSTGFAASLFLAGFALLTWVELSPRQARHVEASNRCEHERPPVDTLAVLPQLIKLAVASAESKPNVTTRSQPPQSLDRYAHARERAQAHGSLPLRRYGTEVPDVVVVRKRIPRFSGEEPP